MESLTHLRSKPAKDRSLRTVTLCGEFRKPQDGGQVRQAKIKPNTVICEHIHLHAHFQFQSCVLTRGVCAHVDDVAPPHGGSSVPEKSTHVNAVTRVHALSNCSQHNLTSGGTAHLSLGNRQWYRRASTRHSALSTKSMGDRMRKRSSELQSRRQRCRRCDVWR